MKPVSQKLHTAIPGGGTAGASVCVVGVTGVALVVPVGNVTTGIVRRQSALVDKALTGMGERWCSKKNHGGKSGKIHIEEIELRFWG